MIKNLIHSFVVIVTFLALTFYTGCDTAETTDGTVTVSFSPPSITPKISADTIQLDTVKILLRDVKIKNQSGNDETNIKVGPFVVYLSINGMTTNFAAGSVPPKSYDRIRFRVHTLEDSETPPDPEFKEGNLRYSVIVKGLYNSVPFVYKSKKSAHQDLKLEIPIQVADNSTANLTITVDPLSWFIKDTILMDPTNQTNESDIDNNIEFSFKKSFRDDDHDGK